MEDKRDILKTLIRKVENRVLALEMEKKSIQDTLDECYLDLEGHQRQLAEIDAAVYIHVPSTGQTRIQYPQTMMGG